MHESAVAPQEMVQCWAPIRPEDPAVLLLERSDTGEVVLTLVKKQRQMVRLKPLYEL